ncbi:YeeE/YedE family protein [Oricola sp.]|uniref:YeeE/YedE family protein n=1 Tax=Oricola sp. TaxID=1979950 RepID=UPI003BAC5E4D
MLDNPWALPAAGLLVGVVMGYIARRSHFCAMNALERHWYAADSRGIRSWVLAAAIALLATQTLQAAGLVDLSSSFYLAQPLPIAGTILGGLMFGFGMALVGTCGFGALVRLGGGNLRALVVLVAMGLAAMAAMRGLTGLFRVNVLDRAALDLEAYGGQSLGAILETVTGWPLTLPLAYAIAALLLVWIFRDTAFRRDGEKILAGVTVGAAIAAGWLITWYFSQRLMVPVQLEAGSFVVPPADAILLIVTVTGTLPDYGVGLAAGVFLGAAASAWRSNDMRWEACDDARELSRHLLGAFLMGTGGVFAMGCTIGQGVSAVSVMAVSAPLAVASIVLGARIGLGVLVEGSAFGFLRHATGNHPAE